jgi:hypothetical protein
LDIVGQEDQKDRTDLKDSADFPIDRWGEILLAFDEIDDDPSQEHD